MKIAAFFATVIVAGGLSTAACSKPLPISPNARAVYAELVESGCMANNDSGLASVQMEYNTDAAPSWFTCLWDGGSISACGVPCSSDDAGTSAK